VLGVARCMICSLAAVMYCKIFRSNALKTVFLVTTLVIQYLLGCSSQKNSKVPR
jgi:hypothetical protein